MYQPLQEILAGKRQNKNQTSKLILFLSYISEDGYCTMNFTVVKLEVRFGYLVHRQ